MFTQKSRYRPLMEPTNGRVAWGRTAWSFLHGMTLDPVAPPAAKRAQKKVLELLRYVLPCPTCQKSYRQFSSRISEVPPEEIGDWVVEIHDQVNLKLDKPAAKFPPGEWKEFQLRKFSSSPEGPKGEGPECPIGAGYASYVEDMFFFLFTLAANYPRAWTQETQVAEKYREFFNTLPQAMIHRPWGKKMAEYMQQHPLTSEILGGGRNEFIKWVYNLYLAVPHGHKEGQSRPSFSSIMKSMEIMRK